MILYRISNCARAKDVSGTGAKLFGGRWNSIGYSMHYMATSRSLAALEILANKNTLKQVTNFCMTVFELPESSIQFVEVEDLPANWKTYPSPEKLKAIGDQFIRQNDFLLLRVPSALVEEEYNFLMNVSHPLSKQLKIIEIKEFTLDHRLV